MRRLGRAGARPGDLTSQLPAALSTAGGHILVTGAESQLSARTVRRMLAQCRLLEVFEVSLRKLGAEAALARALRDTADGAGGQVRERLAALVDRARKEGAPFVVLVRANGADAAEELERLCLLIECRPDAITHARLVVVGDDALAVALASGRAPSFQSRIVRRFRLAPSVPAAFAPAARRLAGSGAVLLGVALLLAALVGIGDLRERAPGGETVTAMAPQTAGAEGAHAPADRQGPRRQPSARAIADTEVEPLPAASASIASPEPPTADARRNSATPTSGARGRGSRPRAPVRAINVAPTLPLVVESGTFDDADPAFALKRALARELALPVVVARIETSAGARYAVRIAGSGSPAEIARIEAVLRAKGQQPRRLVGDPAPPPLGPRFGPHGRRPAWIRSGNR